MIARIFDGLLSIMAIAVIVLTILKASGAIDWSWWYILGPFNILVWPRIIYKVLCTDDISFFNHPRL